MASPFAYIVLFSWPLVVFVLFRRLSLPTALTSSLLAGFLFLPSRPTFDFPLMPPIGKGMFISVFPVIFAAMAVAWSRPKFSGTDPETTDAPPLVLSGWLPRNPVMLVLMVALLASPFLTMVFNRAPLFYGPRVLPGMSPYDSVSLLMISVIEISPLLLARKYLADARSHTIILRVMCTLALVYSLLALYEVRMSPQLNNMLYGFFPHSWIQHVKAGGYRPLVFLSHGLHLAIFLAISIIATLAAWRQDRKAWRLGAAVWLLMILVLSKNLGSSIITLFLAPLVLFAPNRTQAIVAGVIAGLVLVYPVLRSQDLAPTDSVVRIIKSFNAERAGSFLYRVENEDILLDKASRKPILGWGNWGRARVYNEDGVDVSVTDGGWIIEYGFGGWVRYIATFGIIGLPILLLALRFRRYDLTFATAGLCVGLAANLVDLIPNSSMLTMTWLLTGALMGRLELAAESESPAVEARATPAPRHPVLRRTFSDKPDPDRITHASRRPPATPGPRAPAMTVPPKPPRPLQRKL